MSEVKHSSKIESEILLDIREAIKSLEFVRDDYIEINDYLGKPIGWAGASHDMCIDAHSAVSRYEESIRPVCEQFRDMLDELNLNVENFI